MDFRKELKDRIIDFEEKMVDFLPKEEGYQKVLFEAMNYSINAGGKRLRPVLIKESYRLCGGNDNEYLPLSVAMEMIHTYSLIHDDLPALDNDDLRRGKPTNHVIFGEAMAILAGDGLLNYAYEIMLDAAVNSENKSNYVSAISEISKGAGINGMIGGQVVDVLSEHETIPVEKLNFIHLNKTAAMIVACMKSGAILAGASDEGVKALETYGQKIGLAFQIVDDILDIVGDEKELGKHVGSDLENEKSTYPSIFGIEESKKIADKLIEEAKEELTKFDKDKSEFLLELSNYIISRTK